MLPGIGAKSATKLWAAFRACLAKEITQQPSLGKALRDITGQAPKKAALGWEQFAETIDQLLSLIHI